MATFRCARRAQLFLKSSDFLLMRFYISYASIKTNQAYLVVLQEVGPYDVGWKPRKHSWVQKASILFVDNPVGTGFSYVKDGTNFTHTNAEIAADLLTFLKKFLHEQPEVREPTELLGSS